MGDTESSFLSPAVPSPLFSLYRSAASPLYRSRPLPGTAPRPFHCIARVLSLVPLRALSLVSPASFPLYRSRPLPCTARVLSFVSLAVSPLYRSRSLLCIARGLSFVSLAVSPLYRLRPLPCTARGLSLVPLAVSRKLCGISAEIVTAFSVKTAHFLPVYCIIITDLTLQIGDSECRFQ